MYRQYTKCFSYHTGDEKPFHASDKTWIALKNGALGAFFGALTGVVVGLLVGGPVGAVVGLLVGVFSGTYVGMSISIVEVANKWLFHRLVCLSGDVCAIGTVLKSPEDGGLGNFDNDEFFELVPMPYPSSDGWVYTGRDDWKGATGKAGRVKGAKEQAELDSHPKNDLVVGNPQGVALIRQVEAVTADLSYVPNADELKTYDPAKDDSFFLHCEAEGDFWVRMKDLASAIAALAAVGAVATVAAGAAGYAAAAAFCAATGIFWLLCFIIGAIIIALFTAAAAGLTYVALKAALQGLYDANIGDVEDAHVGATAKDPIKQGDRVAVYGTHVYDGHHKGWNEIHPLKLVVRISDIPHYGDLAWYLEWDPTNANRADVTPPGAPALAPEDFRVGLESEAFRNRAVWVKDRWCELITEAFSDTVRTTQGLSSQQWTIHPTVDGCRDREHIH